MKQIYKEQLFQEKYIVSDIDQSTENAFEVVFSFAALFNIRITSGEKLAQIDMIRFVSEQLGVDVPESYYRGFPASVKSLSSDEMLFVQLYRYSKTHGLNLFEEGNSFFESFLDKTAFREQNKIQDYAIISERDARVKIDNVVADLLQSPTPLTDKQYDLVLEYVRDFDCDVSTCGCKDTAIRLLADSRNMNLIHFLSMQDLIPLVEEINYRSYGVDDIKRLNLRNPDKKFISEVLDKLLENSRCGIEKYCDKMIAWTSLLRQLGYRATDDLMYALVACCNCNEKC
ncbi:MAG: hypothetical protein IIY94_02070 [Oscillospiraceae bacterium]|nr:hypothetical protein [Oscillospiraceae bacterium]